jgi:hypothetical protein
VLVVYRQNVKLLVREKKRTRNFQQQQKIPTKEKHQVVLLTPRTNEFPWAINCHKSLRNCVVVVAELDGINIVSISSSSLARRVVAAVESSFWPAYSCTHDGDFFMTSTSCRCRLLSIRCDLLFVVVVVDVVKADDETKNDDDNRKIIGNNAVVMIDVFVLYSFGWL